LVVPSDQEQIAEAAAQLGKLEPGAWPRIVRDLDYIRVFVGKANVVACLSRVFRCPEAFPLML
jgi:putative transport protein